ncbi:monovalent cation/H(+) antiporter subunit G [Kangiella aquimarina]|uniref:Monovalent cation/H(+) antiporter subunit G n=1 Tax=Kangiella aquimarina TaxID=261965 RepID=A0ABZ0X2Y7_9GAMM|nr:monovalent cation/H(+) antiporter subunit G [Kangiella aquimarina]WQG84952.1 monovalent cation/H(+) antiporter subunit G [Kangiella aquimarina]
MAIFLDAVSWALLVLGGFMCFSGAVGIHRFPDFFSRMHAAGVTDTLGSSLILIGLMLQTGWQDTVLVKLLLIFLFILLTSPTASHALAKAALHGGLRPKLGKPEVSDDIPEKFGKPSSESTNN